jgi:hypothetical protein
VLPVLAVFPFCPRLSCVTCFSHAGCYDCQLGVDPCQWAVCASPYHTGGKQFLRFGAPEYSTGFRHFPRGFRHLSRFLIVLLCQLPI